MEVFKRQIGEALKIKHKLDDGAAGKYVRAFLRDKLGAIITPNYLDLNHVGFGVYVENTFAMPNIDQLIVNFGVFTDNTYTIKDGEYTEDLDIFEKDTLDVSNLFPPPAKIELQFKRPMINVEIVQDQIIEGDINE